MIYLFFTARSNSKLFRHFAAVMLALGFSIGGCEMTDEQYSLEKNFDGINHSGIVNGTVTAEGEYNGVVALRMKSNICTGTLIDPNVVVTAAHCVHYLDFDITEEPESITVYGGPQMTQRLSEAIDVLTHVTWKGKIKKNSVDLALIILDTPISHTAKYCVRADDKYDIGTKGFIVGYGRPDKEGRSGTKRVGKTTVLDKKDSDGLIELGYPTSTCLGDSGGPFFTVSKRGHLSLAGVTSFGSGSCDATSGAYNVNIVKYRKWIEKTVEQFTRRPLIECADISSSYQEDTQGYEETDEKQARLQQDENLDESSASQEIEEENVCVKYPEFCEPEENDVEYEEVYEDEVTCSFATSGSRSPKLLSRLIRSLF